MQCVILQKGGNAQLYNLLYTATASVSLDSNEIFVSCMTSRIIFD